ncbi:unnamed protein product [Caenorhabditis auriculariae]|uniref:Uncharacterized protein n=1 Tax=Caenorhabditis auriculariae TaxID=2777116 RepID=A0A8S1GP82_9PELO|nr:unnamed protein product [Caenorhabditis auriculariae]
MGVFFGASLAHPRRPPIVAGDVNTGSPAETSRGSVWTARRRRRNEKTVTALRLEGRRRMALLKVRDECTKLVGHRFLNSHICLCISLVQLLVCCWAVAQHANSYIVYHKILKCDFLEGSLPLEAVDAVIFDVRLFHYLWGIRGCVAEYLDGGFGRLAWCISHSTSLLFSLPVAFISHPRPCYFWPLLVQQSAYGICLLILLLAALPRIVVLLAAPYAAPLAPILFYFFGTSLNFFHLYVYWHWYWHVSSRWNSVVRVKFGERLMNANNRSRRDKPLQPVVVDDAVLHYVPQETTSPLPPPPPLHRRSTTSLFEGLPRVFTPLEEADEPLEESEEMSPPPHVFATRVPLVQGRVRRQLPPTPNLPMHGELPRFPIRRSRL